MATIPILETPRLRLCPVRLEDAEQVQAIFPRWEVVRYLENRVPWPYPAGGVHQYYRDMLLPAVQRGEEWHWSLRLKSDPQRIIGAIGLFANRPSNRGFWIGPAWQRQGLTSEACEAVTDYWFFALGFPVLRVSKAAANVGSRRISEKQGMRLVTREEKDYVSGRLPSELWEITAEEWKAHKRA